MRASRAELHRAAMQAWVDAEVRELSIELAVEMVLAQQTIESGECSEAARECATALFTRLRGEGEVTS